MLSDQSLSVSRRKIPLTIVGGAAASGKSTLVRHLLTHCDDRHVVALVRRPPFDDVAPDERWIVVADDGADVLAALAALAERDDRPEHVVIECDSAADLRRASGYGYMPGFHFDGTILVTAPPAASAAETELAVDWPSQRHTNAADVIVLNKVDCVEERVARAAQRALERSVPFARIVWADHGRVAPPLLLGPKELPEPLALLDGQITVAPWNAEYAPVHARRDRAGKTGAANVPRAQLNESHRTWCLVADDAIDGREFRHWVQSLPRGIVSGRGVVYLAEAAQHRHVFQFLGRRWRLDREQPWGAVPPSTCLWLVGAAEPT